MGCVLFVFQLATSNSKTATLGETKNGKSESDISAPVANSYAKALVCFMYLNCF
jgi:hypothetical protein